MDSCREAFERLEQTGDGRIVEPRGPVMEQP
jgi:hypothetical protein